MIPLSRPDITEREEHEVLSVLRTPALSIGPKLVEFENRMAQLHGVRHAIAVSSGTAGLHLAVRAAGIEPGNEVITTPFSFVASANVMLFEQACPVFVDIDPETLNLSPDSVAETIARQYTQTPRGLINRTTGGRLVGLLPVDVFGHPVDIRRFRALADQYDLWLVEDACEALGSQVFAGSDEGWVSAGRLADLAVYAFYPNKQLTTGEGGLITTNDSALARRCRMGRNQGRSEQATWLDHATLGYNYRMDELSAALGVAQLARFGEMSRRRQLVARWYQEALKGVSGLRLPTAAPWARVNWFVYVVRVIGIVERETLMAFFAAQNIQSRAYFPPIHLQPYYRDRFGFVEGMFPVCEQVAKTTLALPFFNNLSRREVEFIGAVLREGVEARVSARQA